MEVHLDLGVYPLEVVMSSAYVFIDRCYVLIDKEAPERVRVSLRPKPSTQADALAAIGGELENELLSQALRLHIGTRHDKLREVLVARALFGAAPELDEGGDAALGDIDTALANSPDVPADTDDYLDDPLGIAVPWEQKAAAASPPAGDANPAETPPPAEPTAARGESK